MRSSASRAAAPALMLRPDDDLPCRIDSDASRLGADAAVQAGGSHAIVVEPGKSVTGAERNFGIDLLRGADVLLMLFVNEVAGVTGAPAFLLHKGADTDAVLGMYCPEKSDP